VLLRAFLGGAFDPGVLELDDPSLVEIARRELSARLGISGAPTLMRLFRWPSATPQMEVGHLERVAEIERQAGAVPGLFLTGAGLRTTGIPDGIADATHAASQAAAFCRSPLS
jgi:oxygen-dependent protoporphyrinogen oxidase